MPGKKKVNHKRSGLLHNSKPVFLAVAKILKPHGLKGEVTVDLLSDFPNRFKHGRQVFIGKDHLQLNIDSIRRKDKHFIFSFKSHLSRESVDAFRNQILYVIDQELPELTEDEYYHHDLIGMNVHSVGGKKLGVLTDIIQTGANDVYVISSSDDNSKDLLVPAIGSVVVDVDLPSKRMIIAQQDWL